MSQQRPSYEGGPSKPPIYLSRTPMSTRKIQSPRTSGFKRQGQRSSSAYDSFDAPAYCEDMAAYIAAQLASRPIRTHDSNKENQVQSFDSWRGSTRQEGQLADVSIQTASNEHDERQYDGEDDDDEEEGEEENQEGSNDEEGEVDEDEAGLDLARTMRTKAAAESFLKQLQEQPDDLTETERELEEQVFSLFAQSTEQKEPVSEKPQEEINVDPEVAAQIAGMLAKPAKTNGPLIQEVNAGSEESDSSSSSSSNSDDSEEEESEEENSVEVENDEIDAETSDEDEEMDDEPQLDQDAHPMTISGENYQLPSEQFGYHEDDQESEEYGSEGLSQNNPFAQSETIELLDSDDDDIDAQGEETNIYQEEEMEAWGEGQQQDETESSELEQDDDEDSEADEVIEEEAVTDFGDIVEGEAVEEEEALDVGGDFEGQAIEEGVDQSSSIDPLTVLESSQAEMPASFVGSNLFEQPNATFADFAEFTSPVIPAFSFSQALSNSTQLMEEQQVAIESETAPITPTTAILSQFTDTAASSPRPVLHSDEPIPPSISQELQGTSTGADLVSLKQHINRGALNVPQPDSVDVNPGTPLRSVSVEEQPKHVDDGHARHARDLFQIKSVAQRALNGQTSLATSMASDVDSIPHQSDVETVEHGEGGGEESVDEPKDENTRQANDEGQSAAEEPSRIKEQAEEPKESVEQLEDIDEVLEQAKSAVQVTENESKESTEQVEDVDELLEQSNDAAQVIDEEPKGPVEQIEDTGEVLEQSNGIAQVTDDEPKESFEQGEDPDEVLEQSSGAVKVTDDEPRDLHEQTAHTEEVHAYEATDQKESPSKKRRSGRHSRHKSDASGDLADYVPDAEVEEEEESDILRPAKKAKKEGEEVKVADENAGMAENDEADADEDMLDVSILEESGYDQSQMDIDESNAGQEEEDDDEDEQDQEGDKVEGDGEMNVVEETEGDIHDRPTTRSRRRSSRKSNDSSFKLTKVEQSESEEDEEVKKQKAKKAEQLEKKKEADRERRRIQREAKKLEKEALKKEEKEAEKAAAGLKRTRRVSEDAKSFRPPSAGLVEEEEEESVAKRRGKRRASRPPSQAL